MIKKEIAESLKQKYKIGDILITGTSDKKDPKDTFGFGEWEYVGSNPNWGDCWKRIE